MYPKSRNTCHDTRLKSLRNSRGTIFKIIFRQLDTEVGVHSTLYLPLFLLMQSMLNQDSSQSFITEWSHPLLILSGSSDNFELAGFWSKCQLQSYLMKDQGRRDKCLGVNTFWTVPGMVQFLYFESCDPLSKCFGRAMFLFI